MATTTAPPELPPTALKLDLSDTYGALFIGLIVAAVLFGITNLQVFVYSQSYKEDKIWSKLAVAWLWLLDALHLALISHAVYFYLVTNYVNPLELTFVVWSFHLQLVIDMVTIVTVQALYAVRLWRLASIYERNVITAKVIPFVVTVLVVVAAGICIMVAKYTYAIKSFTDMDTIKWATVLALVTASVVDALIAAALCFTLARLRTGISQTDSMINQLMLFILNSGVLTSLCSITAVSLYAAYPHSFIFLAVEFLLTKLYVNSFLAMFNARHRLKAAMDKTVDISKWDGAVPVRIKGPPGSGLQKVVPGEAGKSGKIETLVFSHSFSESDQQNTVSDCPDTYNQSTTSAV